MQAMQRLQPEIKQLQAKYKDDRQKLNEEMMEFYKEHKINPLAVPAAAPADAGLHRPLPGDQRPDHSRRGGSPRAHPRRAASCYQALVESRGKMMSLGIDLSEAATDVERVRQRHPLLPPDRRWSWPPATSSSGR